MRKFEFVYIQNLLPIFIGNLFSQGPSSILSPSPTVALVKVGRFLLNCGKGASRHGPQHCNYLISLITFTHNKIIPKLSQTGIAQWTKLNGLPDQYRNYG